MSDLPFRARTKKSSTAASKHLEILPKTCRGGNSPRVRVKTDSSAAIIHFVVYSVMWCGGSLKCNDLKCAMACSVVVLWWIN